MATSESGGNESDGNSAQEKGNPASRRGIKAPEAMRRAAEQLFGMLGSAPDAVSAVKKTEEGWTAMVEVVEIERIPDTSSVMASYRVDLDSEGDLTGYEKVRRYSRGHVER